jgi:hypothetical protein
VGKVKRDDPKIPLLFEIFVERASQVHFPKASLFNPFEGIEIQLKKTTLKVYLEPLMSELAGMLCMGNRPSQILESEEEPFDWVIACERIRGEEIEQFSFCVEME